jgi:hypothetical protein
MPVVDDLVRLLRDHEVGLWCKRAAWLIALVNVALVALQLPEMLSRSDPATLSLTILATLLGALANTLWQFSVLYALGAIVTSLVRS